MSNETTARLHGDGIVDMHFDLPVGLLLSESPCGAIARDFLPGLKTGGGGVLAVAIFIQDKDVPRAYEIALEEIALLNDELARTPELVLCRDFAEIENARANHRIALLLTMEGVEPLGADLARLPEFYGLGLRSLMLTHARANAAAAGGIFAATGSPAHGLTDFGRKIVRACERLGILLDLAHINPAGFEEICALTASPLIVSHTNARRFHDIERNISDAQIKMIGARGGVIGINAVLVSPRQEDATIDRYIDHIAHVADLIGINHVALGFDFFEFIYQQMCAADRAAMEAHPTRARFIPDLSQHAHAQNLTCRLFERGFAESDVEKILRGNWLRVLKEIL
ncbi:MAG: membrane dipeptidase [Verrucomicrobiota bacterium]|nr:membrane dipeptidase [Verrucomicrobiota bacterium]